MSIPNARRWDGAGDPRRAEGCTPSPLGAAASRVTSASLGAQDRQSPHLNAKPTSGACRRAPPRECHFWLALWAQERILGTRRCHEAGRLLAGSCRERPAGGAGQMLMQERRPVCRAVIGVKRARCPRFPLALPAQGHAPVSRRPWPVSPAASCPQLQACLPVTVWTATGLRAPVFSFSAKPGPWCSLCCWSLVGSPWSRRPSVTGLWSALSSHKATAQRLAPQVFFLPQYATSLTAK